MKVNRFDLVCNVLTESDLINRPRNSSFIEYTFKTKMRPIPRFLAMVHVVKSVMKAPSDEENRVLLTNSYRQRITFLLVKCF